MENTEKKESNFKKLNKWARVNPKIFWPIVLVLLIFCYKFIDIATTPSDCDCIKICRDGGYWELVGSDRFQADYGYEFNTSGYTKCMHKWKINIDKMVEGHLNEQVAHPEYINADAYFEDVCNGKIK